MLILLQAWPVLTAALLRRPPTVPPHSAGGRSEATGQQHHGGGAKTATASAALLLIRWDRRHLVALAGQAAAPEPRAPTAAGELRRLYLFLKKKIPHDLFCSFVTLINTFFWY